MADQWLKQELEKLMRARFTIAFTYIREEAVVLARDQDESPYLRPRQRKGQHYTVYSEEVEENSLVKFIADMSEEMSNLRLEVQ